MEFQAEYFLPVLWVQKRGVAAVRLGAVLRGVRGHGVARPEGRWHGALVLQRRDVAGQLGVVLRGRGMQARCTGTAAARRGRSAGRSAERPAGSRRDSARGMQARCTGAAAARRGWPAGRGAARCGTARESRASTGTQRGAERQGFALPKFSLHCRSRPGAGLFNQYRTSEPGPGSRHPGTMLPGPVRLDHPARHGQTCPPLPPSNQRNRCECLAPSGCPTRAADSFRQRMRLINI